MKELKKELREQFDEIDNKTIEKAKIGFYESRLAIEWGMWEKGKAIASYFRGVNYEVSWAELKRKTGRSDMSLKKWHDIYRAYPKEKDYEPIAKEAAKTWTDKACNKEVPPAKLIENHQQKTIPENHAKEEYLDEEKAIESEPKENGQQKIKYKFTETYETSSAMAFAIMAISQLERIRDDDPKREEALIKVEQWIQKNRKGKPS